MKLINYLSFNGKIGGGADQIRTGDGGFAGPCLTTWRRRPTGRVVWLEGEFLST